MGVRRMSAYKTEKREEERSVSARKIYKNRMRMPIFNRFSFETHIFHHNRKMAENILCNFDI